MEGISRDKSLLRRVMATAAPKSCHHPGKSCSLKFRMEWWF